MAISVSDRCSLRCLKGTPDVFITLQRFSRALAFVCLLLGLSACGGSDGLSPHRALPRAGAPFEHDLPPADWEPSVTAPEFFHSPSSCQTGGIFGNLCAPGSEQPLSAAKVYVYGSNCSGDLELHATTLRKSGYFALANLPVGRHQVYVEQEDALTRFEVEVEGGMIRGLRDVGELACAQPPAPRLAVISGEYDPVGGMLEEFGVAYDTYGPFVMVGERWSEAYDFLNDLERMRQYDVILFACGDLDHDFLASHISSSPAHHTRSADISFDYGAPVYGNLRRFVAGGGSLYASDWAWPVIEGVGEHFVNFFGDEDNGREVLVGVESEVSSTIHDSALGNFMNAEGTPVVFNLQGWAVIDHVSDHSEVLLSADVAVKVTNDVDSEDPEHIAQEELSDRPLVIGTVPFAGGGTMLYTSFHHHAQPTDQMLSVLRYMLFQL